MAKQETIGNFFGVGLGPGDPELMTLKSVRVLRSSQVIAVPCSKADDGSVAHGIVKAAASLLSGNGNASPGFDETEFLDLVLPMTRDPDILLSARLDAARKIAEKLKAGLDVSFVTVGDPMFYSTFSYLVPHVRRLVPTARIESVAGVSSVNAAACALEIPLCEAHERVAVLPAVYDVKEVRSALENFDTVVLMKVNRVLDDVLDLLAQMKITKNAAFISKVSWPEEAIIRDVESLRGTKSPYFSMMVIKKNS